MIERIVSAMQDGHRRFPLRYRRMINCLADRFAYVRSTYLLGKPMQTPGTELLKYLINNLDVAELDKYSSDIERYTEVIKFFKFNYLQSFDPVVNGSVRGGKWVSTNAAGGLPPPEVILNVDCSDPVHTLPLEKPWPDWQEQRGVRILYHDSLELIERFTTSMFEFKTQMPSVIVVSLDVPILLFKYYKYWKNSTETGVPANVNEFIKHHEYAHFFDDLLDIWTLNFLTLVYKNPDMDSWTILEKLAVPQRICTPGMLVQGIDGVKEFLALVKSGQIKPQDFLETNWFVGGSIRERMTRVDHWCDIPDRRQYLWCNAVLWLPYLDLLLTLTGMFPNGAVNQLIRERCSQVYVNKFKYAAMPSMARGEALRSFVDKLDTEVTRLLDGQNPVPSQR